MGLGGGGAKGGGKNGSLMNLPGGILGGARNMIGGMPGLGGMGGKMGGMPGMLGSSFNQGMGMFPGMMNGMMGGMRGMGPFPNMLGNMIGGMFPGGGGQGNGQFDMPYLNPKHQQPPPQTPVSSQIGAAGQQPQGTMPALGAAPQGGGGGSGSPFSFQFPGPAQHGDYGFSGDQTERRFGGFTGTPMAGGNKQSQIYDPRINR